MVSVTHWLEGARIRTLPAAAAPVLLGSGAATNLGGFCWGKTLLALCVALLLQIGVNFANDYSDGIRGTDRGRLGPMRLTGSGSVSAETVLLAAMVSFGLAGAAGVALVFWSGIWWLLIVGVLAVMAAWFYTGGKSPYGYLGIGLSELLVFVFFGLVATVGTTLVQSGHAPWWVWVAASGVGLASVALLMVNNIRDIPTDSQCGKCTVAVRLGNFWSRIVYEAILVLSITCGFVAASGFTSSWRLPFLVANVLFLAALFPAAQVARGHVGFALLSTLRNTGFYVLIYGMVLAAAFATFPAE